MMCLLLLQNNTSHGKNIILINMLRLSGTALRRHMVAAGTRNSYNNMANHNDWLYCCYVAVAGRFLALLLLMNPFKTRR